MLVNLGYNRLMRVESLGESFNSRALVRRKQELQESWETRVYVPVKQKQELTRVSARYMSRWNEDYSNWVSK